MIICNEMEDGMKKLFAFFILLMGTGLVAINEQENNELAAQKDASIVRMSLSRSNSRSITPSSSPESSDNESDESSSEESSDDTYEPFIHESKIAPLSLSAKPFLERFGGYFFGGALAVLITYKFYSAGYL